MRHERTTGPAPRPARMAALGILALLPCALLARAAAAEPPVPAALRILLTNDDGWDAPGLGAVHEVLRAAGHDVTVVAPATQQSGRGTAISTDFERSVALVERAPGVYSVEGTPTDAAAVGLEVVLAGRPPDLVVSGANFGQNVTLRAVSSGTVGAAVAAIQRGVPAVALSVEVRLDERSAEPAPFPSTRAAFEPAALALRALIEQLAATRPAGGALLPAGLALSVNHPARPAARVRGWRQAPLASRSPFRFAWAPTPDGGVRVHLVQDAGGGPEPGSDAALLGEGYVTWTALDGNWSVAGAQADGLAARLAPLEAASAAGAGE